MENFEGRLERVTKWMQRHFLWFLLIVLVIGSALGYFFPHLAAWVNEVVIKGGVFNLAVSLFSALIAVGIIGAIMSAVLKK